MMTIYAVKLKMSANGSMWQLPTDKKHIEQGITRYMMCNYIY